MRRSYHVVLTCVRLFALVLALLALPTWALAQEHGAIDAGAVASPSASAAPAVATTDVKVRDKVVFTFLVAHGERTPAQRAKEAQGAIDTLLLHPEQLGEARFEEQQGNDGWGLPTAVIFVGKAPVLTLAAEDAQASG